MCNVNSVILIVASVILDGIVSRVANAPNFRGILPSSLTDVDNNSPALLTVRRSITARNKPMKDQSFTVATFYCTCPVW